MQSKHTESMELSQRAATRIAPRVWPVLTLSGRINPRTAVILWSAGGIGIGLLLSWSWLVAAGLSSLVVAIVPCAAMCAAGLCMGSGNSKKTDPGAKVGSGRDKA
jgi:hypothetical protein